jgi:hypothetical protein
MTPLHVWGEFIRRLLLSVPLPVVRILFILVPLALLVWVLFLPKKEVTQREGSGSLGGNLKLWAAIALLIQILLYALL